MLTVNTRDRLNSVLSLIHKKFIYEEDMHQFGKQEDWRFPKEFNGKFRGDCDDFAIACRQRLKSNGLPSRLAICKTEKGEYHLVCVMQQYVLDNRQDRAKTKEQLTELGYKWLYISGFNAGDPWRELK